MVKMSVDFPSEAPRCQPRKRLLAKAFGIQAQRILSGTLQITFEQNATGGFLYCAKRQNYFRSRLDLIQETRRVLPG
ncbi:MAG: hypothetical protein DME33_06000 [Verrucomicrobia bacterium]|nr:MAG: hypothetical protein DME33_06000 [Verrucomicrobiota bacterium]